MSLPIGDNIKKLRNEQQVTQEQLAEHLNISYQAISKWENNITVPDVSLLPLIAEYFEVSIDELFQPNMTAYRNKEARLSAIYESTRSTEDFNRANQAYQKLFASTDNFTHEDLMYYAIMHDHRSRDYVDKAIELYNKAIKLGEQVRDTAYYKSQRQLIGLLYRNNRNQESIDKYEEVIKNEPGNIQHYVSLGLAYQFSKQYDKAWKLIESGLKIDENNALLLNFAGEICKCLGKYEDAIAFWDKSFEIDNEMPDNLFSKAFLHQELDAKEKAIEMWNKIIKWLEHRRFDVDVKWANKELEKLSKNKV
jgi:transcriptional regulator with XRE-family HTH domain